MIDFIQINQHDSPNTALLVLYPFIQPVVFNPMNAIIIIILTKKRNTKKHDMHMNSKYRLLYTVLIYSANEDVMQNAAFLQVAS